MKRDKILFQLLDKITQKRWKRFKKFYINDSKLFINKISRDYEKTGKFPIHVLKTIESINKENYDSEVCILRGALPYSVLFEANGWKIHYVLCGRKNEQNGTLRFSKSVDKTMKKIMRKKILFIENNSPSGNTPILVLDKISKKIGIKKPDLFLDYFIWDDKKPYWLKKAFWENKERLRRYEKVFVARKIKVKESEREKLVADFIEKLRKM